MSGLLRVLFRPWLRMTNRVVLASWNAEDAREVTAWPLTADRIRRVDQAIAGYGASDAPADHTVHPRGPTRRRSLDTLVGDVTRNERLRLAIEGAGLTAREFVLTREALLQALLAYAMAFGDPSAADEASRVNVSFVARHQAELQDIGRRWQRLDTGGH